jgi:acyl-CoA thioesterase-1
MPSSRTPLSYAVAATVAAGAACGSATSPSGTGSSATPAPRRIVVLGDSLAVSPNRSQNFVSELQARLDATHPGWTLTNQGVSGDTTADGVRRMDTALMSETGILVLELGANDGLRGVAISTVEKNLSTVIERAQSRGIRVLLCGMETPPFNGFNYSLEFHRVYPRLADKYHLPLVPFLLEGVALNPDLNGDDAIHPNAAGAKAIAAVVWPYLEPMVATTAAASVR